jgi:hypothetical protein
MRKLLTNTKAIRYFEFNEPMTSCEIKAQLGIHVWNVKFTAFGKPAPCKQLSPDLKELNDQTLLFCSETSPPSLRVFR